MNRTGLRLSPWGVPIFTDEFEFPFCDPVHFGVHQCVAQEGMDLFLLVPAYNGL